MIIEDKPIFGLGFNEVKNKIFKYQSQYFTINPEDSKIYTAKVNYVFNDFLQGIAENGILFFPFLLFLIVAILKDVFRSDSAARVGTPFMFSYFAILVSSMFSYPLETPGIVVMSFIFLPIIYLYKKQDNSIALSNYFKFPVIGVIVLFSVQSIRNQYEIIRGRQLITIAKQYMFKEDYQNATLAYKAVIEQLPYEKNLLADYGLSLLMSHQYVRSINVFKIFISYIEDPYVYANLGIAYSEIGQFSDAKKHLEKSIKMMPNRLYFRWKLFEVLLKYKDLDSAILVGNKILKMPIKIESMATLEIKSKTRDILNSINKNE